MKTMKAFLLVLIISLMGLWSQSAKSDTNLPTGKILLKIGEEDWNDMEFAGKGFSEHQEYTCHVDVDCSTETFPQRLHRANRGTYARLYTDAGVERITIKFTLEQAYNNVVLRLVRAGDETTVVTVNGKQTYNVTKKMLGSSEGYKVGSYNLSLGTFKKGENIIQLTMADDGEGNGTYQWDALAVIAE